MKKILLMLVAISLMAGSAMALTVADGSFEGLVADGGWAYAEVASAWGYTYYSGWPWVAAAYAPMGNGSDGTGWVELNAGYIHQTISGATAGATYSVEAWSAGYYYAAVEDNPLTTATDETASAYENGMYIYIDGSNISGFVNTSGNVEGFSAWAAYSYEFVAPAESFELKFYGRSETFLDQVSITLVPEPVTLALLGVGGLFLRRKKR